MMRWYGDAAESENMPTLRRTFHPMQRTRIHLEQTESTNDVASQWLKSASRGEVLTVWTSNQTRGRGQRGKAWDQSPGLDLAWTAAVKWPADAPQRDPVVLNKAVTASIRRALSNLLSDSPGVRTVGIKWPNDIVIQNETGRWLKCAGILIENTWRGTTWDGLLVGVGVNVNSTHMEEPRRCALGEFTAAPLTITNVEAHLAQHVLDALEAQDAPSDYDAHLVGRGQTEQFSFEGQSGAGTVKAVNADGALEMEWTPEGGHPRILTVDRSDALTWDWLWK